MSRNLIIIYGAPRTGTTQLWDAIRRHPRVFGSQYTNEPKFDIDYPELLDKLWEDEFAKAVDVNVTTELLPTHMVIKSPGYGFKFDFFENLENYQCYYLFTDRDVVEVVDSMSKHEMSRKICGFDFESADCPVNLRDKFRDKWNKCGGLTDEQRIIRRSHYRYSWHVEGIPIDMLKKSLRLVPYESRLYCNHIAARILGFCGLPAVGGAVWLGELAKFYRRVLSFERKQQIYGMLD